LNLIQSLSLRVLYLTVTLAGLIIPIWLFDSLRLEFYALAKAMFSR
jgi:hypothetical protein